MTAIVVLASVLLTATLSGIFGMGGGMLLMGVLAIALPLSSAMLLHGSTQLAANAYRAFLLRRHIQWRIVWRLGAGALLALVTLAFLQAELGLDAIFVVLGGLPLVVLALPSRFRLSIESRAQAFGCGFLFSALQILAGASGPILDAFFLRGGLSRFAIVATKSTISSFDTSSSSSTGASFSVAPKHWRFQLGCSSPRRLSPSSEHASANESLAGLVRSNFIATRVG